MSLTIHGFDPCDCHRPGSSTSMVDCLVSDDDYKRLWITDRREQRGLGTSDLATAKKCLEIRIGRLAERATSPQAPSFDAQPKDVR